MNHDGRKEGSILLNNVDMDDPRQSGFVFNDGPQFVPGISTDGSQYIFG